MNVALVAGCVLLAVPASAGVSWLALPASPEAASEPERVSRERAALLGALAAMFAVVGWRADGWSTATVLGQLWFAACLVALSLSDLRCLRIPNRLLVITAVGSALLFSVDALWSGGWSLVGAVMVGALVCGAPLFIMHLAHPRELGFGDVKLAVLIGAHVGWVSGAANQVVAFWSALGVVIAACLMAVVGGVVMSRRAGSKEERPAIPFGPYLAAAWVVVVAFGSQGSWVS